MVTGETYAVYMSLKCFQSLGGSHDLTHHDPRSFCLLEWKDAYANVGLIAESVSSNQQGVPPLLDGCWKDVDSVWVTHKESS